MKFGENIDGLAGCDRFTWSVNRGGYTWAKSKTDKNILIETGDRRPHWYHPDNKSKAYFMELLDTQGNPDAIVEFANQFGFLGFSQEHIIDGKMVLGECIEDWQKAVQETDKIILLHDALRSDIKQASSNDTQESSDGKQELPDNTQKLSEFIHWDGKNAVLYKHPATGEEWTISSTDYRPLSMLRWQQGDLVEPAKDVLSLLITEFMQQQRISAEMIWRQNSKPLLRPVSTTLLGFIWLQLARVMEIGATYRHCKECEDWFLIWEGGRPASRKYCSNTCRSRAYRRNQKDKH